MSDEKHPLREVILAYAADLLSRKDREKVSRHLLVCAECRKFLPLPSADRFFGALNRERKIGED